MAFNILLKASQNQLILNVSEEILNITLGPTGLQGIHGNRGYTGSTGLQGIKGNTGPTGFQGIQANTGPTGCVEKVSSENYIFAYKTKSQNCTENYQDMIFDNYNMINGWIPNVLPTGATGFMCNKTGNYMVSYTVQILNRNSSNTVSIRGTGTNSGTNSGTNFEIIGSALTIEIPASSTYQIFSNNFIAQIQSNTLFCMQFASTRTSPSSPSSPSSHSSSVSTYQKILDEMPISGSLTITRIS